MTLSIQLDSQEAGPSKPIVTSFASPAADAEDTLRQVILCLHKSKRIVIVSGAGVSTAAAIPDFRSVSGLFNEKTRGGYSVKDLFHVRCLAHHTLAAKHHELITYLSSLSLLAPPTPFHRYLSSLDQEGRLSRCYTQNIDGLEKKAGLTAGIPSGKRKMSRKKINGKSSLTLLNIPEMGKGREAMDDYEPKVIPLHGLLSTLHCTLCSTRFPLPPYLPLPASLIPCPTCQLESSIRSALSERSRKSGFLRASVVLYGEEHSEGESIGKAVARDLKSVDYLLVCGTSLSVPGVKRVVREMSKAVKARKCKRRVYQEIKTVFVNEEPPSKASEWEGVFDVWVQGDVQRFIGYLDKPEFSFCSPVEAEPTENTPSTPKKRKALSTSALPPTPISLERPRQHTHQVCHTPTKRRALPVYAETLLTPRVEGHQAKRIKVERERSNSPSPTPRRDIERSLTLLPNCGQEY
ncbi:hypothetical protein L204_105419 [Cryptococcus depauperatus]|nr:hypothetical protein L204_02811 [Cryptococcus depauperatus CBS 7855]